MDPQRLEATIAAARDGSPDAYQALLDAYWPRLYGYFLRAIGSHDDAEDLLGELAVKLVRQLKSYDERGRFDHWLFRIAVNMVRDRFRRLKVRPAAVSLSSAAEGQTALAERLAGQSPAVDEELVAGETAAELNEALKTLEPVTRQMIVLRYFSEMGFKEIADTYNCPIGTALAKVHRGLKALRRIMARGSDG